MLRHAYETATPSRQYQGSPILTAERPLHEELFLPQRFFTTEGTKNTEGKNIQRMRGMFHSRHKGKLNFAGNVHCFVKNSTCSFPSAVISNLRVSSER